MNTVHFLDLKPSGNKQLYNPNRYNCLHTTPICDSMYCIFSFIIGVSQNRHGFFFFGKPPCQSKPGGCSSVASNPKRFNSFSTASLATVMGRMTFPQPCSAHAAMVVCGGENRKKNRQMHSGCCRLHASHFWSSTFQRILEISMPVHL